MKDWLIVAIILVIVFIIIPLLLHPLVMEMMYNHYFSRMERTKIEKWDLADAQYLPHKENIKKCAKALMEKPHVEVEIRSRDNLILFGDYFDQGSPTTILFAHGVHSLPMYNFAVQGMELYKEGYNLLFIDERCHDRSEGKYVTFGLMESKDIIDWTKFLDERYHPKSIFIYGMSMGATATSIASADLDDTIVKGLVIDCGFESLRSLEYHIMNTIGIPPFLSYKPFLKKAKRKAKVDLKDVSTTNYLGKSRIPSVFIHGSKDRVTPKEDTIKNFNSCLSDEKQLFISEKAGHTVSTLEDDGRIMIEIKKFINKEKDKTGETK